MNLYVLAELLIYHGHTTILVILYHIHTCINYHEHSYTVESRDYAPFVHVRIGQKWGGGVYARILTFP